MVGCKKFRSHRSTCLWLRRVDAITFPHKHSNCLTLFFIENWGGEKKKNSIQTPASLPHVLCTPCANDFCPISSREAVPSARVTHTKTTFVCQFECLNMMKYRCSYGVNGKRKGFLRHVMSPSTAPSEGPVKTCTHNATASYFGRRHKMRLILTLEWRRRHAILGSSCQLCGCRLHSRGSFAISETDRGPTWFPQMKTEAPRRALNSFCRVFIWSRRVVYCFAPQSPRQRNVWVNNNSHSRWLISTETVQSTD